MTKCIEQIMKTSLFVQNLSVQASVDQWSRSPQSPASPGVECLQSWPFQTEFLDLLQPDSSEFYKSSSASSLILFDDFWWDDGVVAFPGTSCHGHGSSPIWWRCRNSCHFSSITGSSPISSSSSSKWVSCRTNWSESVAYELELWVWPIDLIGKKRRLTNNLNLHW